MANYQEIQALITYYEAFENERKRKDLTEFAFWLAQKLDQKVCTHKTSEMVENMPLFMRNSNEEWTMSTKIGAMLGQIMRFSKSLIKKCLDGLPFQSAEEFGLLTQIKDLKNPSKSELANFLMMEMTTTVEIVKRLIAAGLVEETPDENDKRTKRLRLTTYGLEIQEKSLERMRAAGEISYSTLTESDKIQLLGVLYKLNAHHTNLHQHHREKDWMALKDFLSEGK